MATATKVDLRRELAAIYRAPEAPALVTVPPLLCLMVDGVGDPNTSPAYEDAVGTLYALSYGVRALAAQRGEVPWVVMPLEGLWWADDMAAFTAERRAQWRWTMLIVQSGTVDEELVKEAAAAAVRKKRAPLAEHVRLETLDEGQAVHVLHRGPYSAEEPTIAGMHAFIGAHGLTPSGKHHEVYLSDPRKTAPERMRTILRQPVVGAEKATAGGSA